MGRGGRRKARVLQFVLSGVSIGAIYGLLGLALALSFYVTRVINFAQGQMLTVAIVVAASLSEAGYNPWIGVVLGPIAAGAIGVASYFVAVRPILKADRFSFGWMVSTLGFGLALENAIAYVVGPRSRAFPPLLKHCPKGLAILHDTTSWGMGGFAAFKLAYEKADGKIALDRPITENRTTGATAQLAPDLEAVKSSGADCVEVWLSPPDQAAFVQMLKTSGEHLTVLGESDTCSDNTFSNLAGPAADGVVCAFITAEFHPNDLYKDFADAYRKKYNEEPTQSAEVSYQAVMTLAHVIEQTKSTDHAVLRDAYEKLAGVPGIDGSVIFSPTRHASFTEEELTLVKCDAASKKWVEVHE
jgi:hypothetical protein